VMGISTWEKKELMDAYAKVAYPEVIKTLENYLEGTPVVGTFEMRRFETPVAVGAPVVTPPVK